MAEYLTVEEARPLKGLRLALTVGVPGPWGEAAKGIFHVKGLAFAPVAQYPAMPNEELREWTGHSNAPVAVYDDEEPRAGWAEILYLAERLAPEPPLLPDNAADRAAMFGLSREICGEWGLGWSRRLLMLHPAVAGAGQANDAGAGDTADGSLGYLASRYGYSEAAVLTAPARVVDILRVLTERLRTQLAAGSGYFIGDRLSALDIYWATFAALLRPLAQESCPMPEFVRALYTNADPTVDAAADPVLFEHRDRIYEEYLELPLDF